MAISSENQAKLDEANAILARLKADDLSNISPEAQKNFAGQLSGSSDKVEGVLTPEQVKAANVSAKAKTAARASTSEQEAKNASLGDVTEVRRNSNGIITAQLRGGVWFKAGTNIPVDQPAPEATPEESQLGDQTDNQLVEDGQTPEEQLSPEEQQVQPQQAEQQAQQQAAQGSVGGQSNVPGGGRVGALGLALTGTTPQSNPSIVDFLNASGLASDFGSRSVLAEKLGIPNYTGTADQNTTLLSKLRDEQASVSNISQALAVPRTPELELQHQADATFAGYEITPEAASKDFLGEISRLATSFMDALGLGEASVLEQAEADEIEKLENKRDKEIRDINDNPWLTEGVRLRQIEKAEEKSRDEIGNHEAKLNRLQRSKELMVQQAQWAMGTAISVWDTQQRFNQTQAQALYDRQQDALEWEYKQAVFDQGIDQFESDFAFKQAQAARGIFESDRAFNESVRQFGLRDSGGGSSVPVDPITGRKLSAGEIKDAQDRIDGNETLVRLATEYRSLIDEHGFTNRLFGDKAILGQVESLRGQMTAAYKDAKKLGTLDEGLLTLMESIIGIEPSSGALLPFRNFFGGQANKIVSGMDSLISSSNIELQRDRDKLGIISGSAPSGIIYESPSGNTYNLPN